MPSFGSVRRVTQCLGSAFILATAVAMTPTRAPAQAPAAGMPGPPISLGELLELVQRTYPAIAAADSRVSAAHGVRRSAGVLPNPVFGLGVENATLPGHAPAVGMEREVMTTAMVPLEFTFQRWPRVQRADAELSAATADAFGERQRIALEAARAYYRAALGQVEVATARDLAGWLDSLVAYHETRTAEGLTAEADLLRVRLERERAWSEVAVQEAGLAQAQSLVASFAGRGDFDSGLAVVTPDAPLDLADLAEPAPRGAALDTRPEVQAARARLTAAGAGVGVARAMLVPELGAMVGLKRSAGTTTLLAGVSLPLPLLNQNGGELARARAERDAAGYDLATAERWARAELAGATQAAQRLRDRVREIAGPGVRAPAETGSPLTYLQRADEARRIALGAYREGSVPLIHLLDAARAWGEARLSFYRTLYAQHQSAIMLLIARGRDVFGAIPSPGGR